MDIKQQKEMYEDYTQTRERDYSTVSNLKTAGVAVGVGIVASAFIYLLISIINE